MSNWSHQDLRDFQSKARRDRQIIKELLGKSSKSKEEKKEENDKS